jgi:hypothetical protein
LALTVVSLLRVTTQFAVPEQPPPLQLVSSVPAVNVTDVPLLKTAEQFVVQLLMPVGFDEADPVPDTCTVSVGRLKLAVMVVLAVSMKLQVPVPLHTVAVQPVRFDALLGVAIAEIAVFTG